jgi:hypothetical protein
LTVEAPASVSVMLTFGWMVKLTVAVMDAPSVKFTDRGLRRHRARAEAPRASAAAPCVR